MRLIPCLLAATVLAACGGSRPERVGNVAIRNLGPTSMHFVVVKTPDDSYSLGDIAASSVKSVQIDSPKALYVDFQDDRGHAFTYTLDQTKLEKGGKIEAQIKANRLVNGSAW
jgi:hypothetical protein